MKKALAQTLARARAKTAQRIPDFRAIHRLREENS